MFITNASETKSKRKVWYQFAIIVIICIVVIANILLEEEKDSTLNTESISTSIKHDLSQNTKIKGENVSFENIETSAPKSSKENDKSQQVLSSDEKESKVKVKSSIISTSKSSEENDSKKQKSKNKDKMKRITQISVLGERHCGTTWIYDHLTECFGHTLYVARHLTRYKHWFQFDDGQTHNKTLAISLFRNPYYWVKAMISIPHHSPMHIGMDWKTFLTTPWTMPRVGKDLNITNFNERICQERFYFNEVISCHKYPYPDGYFNHRKKPKYSGHQPFYELKHDGSGEPYNNIMDLRTAKIMNFFEILNYSFVMDYWPMRYEQLLQDGTKGLIRRIADETGVEAKCKPFAPYVKKKRGLENEFVKYLNKHLDWDVERLIGYDKVADADEVATSSSLF